MQHFLHKNEDWLQKEISFPNHISRESKTGRSSVEFLKSSERSKRRKTEDLRSMAETSELAYATQMNLGADGQWDTATVVKDVTCTTAKRGSEYMIAYRDMKNPVRVINEDKALSIVTEAKLTKQQYNIIKKRSKSFQFKYFSDLWICK